MDVLIAIVGLAIAAYFAHPFGAMWAPAVPPPNPPASGAQPVMPLGPRAQQPRSRLSRSHLVREQQLWRPRRLNRRRATFIGSRRSKRVTSYAMNGVSSHDTQGDVMEQGTARFRTGDLWLPTIRKTWR
jgi:hypothetical protein